MPSRDNKSWLESYVNPPTKSSGIYQSNKITLFPAGTQQVKSALEPYEQLEKEFGEWIGNPNTVACSNGTAALHLALEALELPKHTTVYVPDYTMVACARAVTMAGLTPEFIDCNNKLLLDPNVLVQYTTYEGSSVIMPVHIYGRYCDMDAIRVIADSRKTPVVEDMSECHGVNPHPSSDAACWSFYKNKIIAGEEGGMIAFKNPKHAEIARSLRSLGFTQDHDFLHNPRGVNARLSNANASLVLPSLRNVGINILLRAKVVAVYNAFTPKEWQMPRRDVNWVYDIRIPELTREQQTYIVNRLNNRGIQARCGFLPMSFQPEYSVLLEPFVENNASIAAQEVFYMPVSPNLSTGIVKTWCGILKEVVSDVRKEI